MESTLWKCDFCCSYTPVTRTPPCFKRNINFYQRLDYIVESDVLQILFVSESVMQIGNVVVLKAHRWWQSADFASRCKGIRPHSTYTAQTLQMLQMQQSATSSRWGALNRVQAERWIIALAWWEVDSDCSLTQFKWVKMSNPETVGWPLLLRCRYCVWMRPTLSYQLHDASTAWCHPQREGFSAGVLISLGKSRSVCHLGSACTSYTLISSAVLTPHLKK